MAKRAWLGLLGLASVLFVALVARPGESPREGALASRPETAPPPAERPTQIEASGLPRARASHPAALIREKLRRCELREAERLARASADDPEAQLALREVMEREGRPWHAPRARGSLADERERPLVRFGTDDPDEASGWMAEHPADALVALDKVIARTPGRARLHYARALILKALQRTRDAVQAYDAGAAVDDGCEDGRYEAASLLYELGERDAALEHLRILLQRKPEYPGGRRLLGMTLRYEGRTKEAAEWYLGALALEPWSRVTRRELGEMLLTDMGDAERAVEALKPFLDMGPDDAPSRIEVNDALWGGLALARAYRALGRFGEARDVAARLLERYPDDPQAIVERGLAEEQVSFPNPSPGGATRATRSLAGVEP